MAKSNTKHLYPPRKLVPPNHATWQLPHGLRLIKRSARDSSRMYSPI